MIQLLAKRRLVATRGTRCDTRGFGQEDLIEGVIKSTMDLLGEWTVETGQVVVI